MSSEKQADLLVTEEAQVHGIVEKVKEGYRQRLKWPEKRQKEHARSQLLALKRMCDENKDDMYTALKQDLNKCKAEAILAEYNLIYCDIIKTIRDYDDLTKPHPVTTGLAHKMDAVYTKAEPYGTVLIFGAWNYPLELVLQPLIGAVAAGNAVVIKPSELSVNTSNLLSKLIPQYLDESLYTVITGGPTVAQTVLKERFDLIFYTGSTAVGKIVMAEAAKNLTPVVLELGGKSPVIIADDADIAVAARRVAFGKLMNSGQTCIAPDYVLCSHSLVNKFVENYKSSVKRFYGEDVASSPDYGRIVNTRHYDRITNLMDTTKANVELEGARDRTQRFIGPSVYTNVQEDDPLMNEEIFGPLLPIIDIDDVDQAIDFINAREKPLALYVFTSSSSTFDKVASSTSSGSLVQNSLMVQAGVDTLPFGGIGHSGMGGYHGSNTFNAFSHQKPYLKTGTKMDFLADAVYPPHTAREKTKLPIINFIQIPSSSRWSFRPLLILALVALIAYVVQMYGLPHWLFKLGN